VSRARRSTPAHAVRKPSGAHLQSRRLPTRRRELGPGAVRDILQLYYVLCCLCGSRAVNSSGMKLFTRPRGIIQVEAWSPNKGLVAPRSARNLGIESNLMTWVVVTQWVHTRDASPTWCLRSASQDQKLNLARQFNVGGAVDSKIVWLMGEAMLPPFVRSWLGRISPRSQQSWQDSLCKGRCRCGILGHP
jgi:hypothetical protein